MIKTIFIAGIYGVGKDYLCDIVSKKLKIQKYSASQLISAKNKEDYSVNKDVRNLDDNQKILVEEVRELINKFGKIMLTGHMCILNKNLDIEILPDEGFQSLGITHMILLKNNPEIIKANLFKRDNKIYDIDLINRFQQKEEELFANIVETINCKSIIINLQYNSEDESKFVKFLED